MSRPVMPVDPAGHHTDRVGTHGQGGRVGPAGSGSVIAETPPELQLQQHSYPWSDTLNWPGVIEEMQRPSSSALMIADTRWITDVNVLGDADGLPTPFDERQNIFIPIPNLAAATALYMRDPNQASGVPAGVKMTAISDRFSAFLKQVQGHLLGSP